MKTTLATDRKMQFSHARRGATLVELITVISVGSVLLSMLTMIVIRTTRLESTTRGRVAQTLAMTRLSDQFREDVRAAAELAIDAADDDSQSDQGSRDATDRPVPRMVVSLADSIQVQYSGSGRGIDRVVRRSSEVIAKERYRLPEGVHARWSEQQVGAVRLARLDLVPVADGDAAANSSASEKPLFSFVAEIGRHRRPTSAIASGTAADESSERLEAADQEGKNRP